MKTKIASVALATSLLSGTASAALVSHFGFDGDASNSISGQAAGTITGSANFVAGKFGQAVGLNAATDLIDLGSTSLGAIGTADFSISLWVNLNSNTVSGDPAFFSNKDWGNGANIGINYAVKSGGNLDVNTFGAGGGGRHDFQDASTTDLSASGWHNIILIREGTALKYFFDGVSDSADQVIGAAGADYASTNNFILGDDGTGNYNGVSNWSADMLFDDLSVYNHALTAGEITALQTASAVPEPSSTALLGLGGLALILRRRK